MCGRYRRTTAEEELARRYHIPIPPQRDLPISWNIAPSQDVLAIRFNPETKQRRLDALRWGLIPYWAKDPKIAYRTINARAESVDTAPSYRQAFKKRRCLVPADTFYEWKKVVGGKAPYSIGMKDDSPFVLAGLWEGWKDPATDEWRSFTALDGNSISGRSTHADNSHCCSPAASRADSSHCRCSNCDNSRSRTGRGSSRPNTRSSRHWDNCSTILNSPLGRNCRSTLARNSLKGSKQGTGMAAGFQN
jgi:SOS response associated peptidase (SRAP)